MPRFNLVEQLVSAGQADLWLGLEVESKAEVVVKMLRPNSDPNQAAIDIQRFQREIRIQSQLNHAGIMPIISFGTKDDRFWYAMPRAIMTLDDRIAQGVFNEQEALNFMLSICSAVEYAHQEGVLHRDLKPANILLMKNPGDSEPRWVVADFGLCRDSNSDSTQITRTHTAIGTIAYMAPEQFDSAHDSDETADVYALGKVLLFTLKGVHPFPYAKVEQAPPSFRYLISRCLAEEPTDRYESVARLAAALDALAIGDEILVNELETAKRLIAQVQASDPSAASRLGSLLDRERGNVSLLSDIVPMLELPTLKAIKATLGEGYTGLVRALDFACEGSHPFSYTDRIADLFEAIYHSDIDPVVRRIAVKRIMIVGSDHNRFYVRDTFWRIASKAEGSEILMFTDLLSEYPSSADFLRETMSQWTVPSAIKLAID